LEIQNFSTEKLIVSGEEEEFVAYVSSELAELIPWFLDNRRKDIENIEKLVSGGDFRTLERMGHTLKGTCAGYGFDMLGKVGADLETAAKAQNTDEIRRLNEEMRNYVKSVKVVYK